MERSQYTLKEAAEFSGVGIHTGQNGRVRICPAAAGEGIRFKGRSEIIPALAEYVVSTARSTALGKGEETISTVEHLLAALWGLGIDNALIEFSGPEVPILDGSAWPFVQGILQAGLQQQDALAEYLELETPVFVAKGDSLVLAMPAEMASYEGAVYYPCEDVGLQRFRYSVYDDFAVNVAPARTFGFWSEVEQLLAKGLALGGSLSNALIFGRPPGSVSADEPIDKLAAKAGWKSPSGVPLRFFDEAVRHKVLDLIGDMALLGHPLNAFILAIKAGHSLHVDFVRKLDEVVQHVRDH
ncbi:MAG: UDP-3-O-acyl-N-acetylglucosamine deacetylase [bacterium]|nr:UDP-3-O-acyl-N-acetylglucosamine deacetylase [bacterium]